MKGIWEIAVREKELSSAVLSARGVLIVQQYESTDELTIIIVKNNKTEININVRFLSSKPNSITVLKNYSSVSSNNIN